MHCLDTGRLKSTNLDISQAAAKDVITPKAVYELLPICNEIKNKVS